MDLTPDSGRALAARAVLAAPTVLENLFWGWLAGITGPELYFRELAITDLWGPYNVPDDFPGEIDP